MIWKILDLSWYWPKIFVTFSPSLWLVAVFFFDKFRKKLKLIKKCCTIIVDCIGTSYVTNTVRKLEMLYLFVLFSLVITFLSLHDRKWIFKWNSALCMALVKANRGQLWKGIQNISSEVKIKTNNQWSVL